MLSFGNKNELNTYKRAFSEIEEMAKKSAKGDFSARIVHWDEFGELSPTLAAINQSYDLADAFVREAGAALQAALNKEFHRKFLEQGILGDMGRGANIINSAASSMQYELSEELEKRAIEEKIKAQKAADIQRVAAAEGLDALTKIVETELAAMIEQIFGVSKQASDASVALVNITSDVATKANTTDQASQAASENSQSVAAAAEELHASISEITKQVEASQSLVQATASETTDIRDSLSGLTDAANKISSVINIISDIAEQTNLLALNATIEAARAGDAGKGFAVVAAEVKSLANQTAKSSDEINQFVNQMQREVSSAVGQIEKIADKMVDVNSRSDTVSAAVLEQSGTTEEIARSIQSATDSVKSVQEQISSVNDDTTNLERTGSDIKGLVAEIESHVGNLQNRLDDIVVDTKRRAERRNAERVAPHGMTIELRLTGSENIYGPFNVSDISESGLRVAHDKSKLALEADQVIEVVAAQSTVISRVAWVSENEVGISFVDEEAAKKLVSQYAEVSLASVA